MAPQPPRATIVKDKHKIVSKSSPPLQDAIYFRNPFTNVRDPRKTRYLVFVISGNPGLIEYYRSFLNSLNGNLAKTFGSTAEDADAQNIIFEFYGRSMGGFELSAVRGEEEGSSSLPRFMKRKKYYALKDQIDFMEQQLAECVEQLTRGANGQRPKVILIGHSVGSYVLLELIQRHRKRLEAFNTLEANKETEPGLRKRKETGPILLQNEPDIVGGICLFPTVVDIGASEKGQKLTSLSRIPHLPTIVSAFARGLTAVIPQSILRPLVGLLTGMRGHPALVTTAFISSPRGVKQSLVMGIDEMQSITADKWDTEVWGAVYPSSLQSPRPKLFFYFGEEDHWVANRTRDDLMALRGRGESNDEWRPWMEIDKLRIPHGFCIGRLFRF
jgi:pimeloyl-ACP methyl ester carboxylesterase